MTNKHTKSFQKVSQSSTAALGQFELTVEKLRKDNEELSTLHDSVDSDIEELKELKKSVVSRISNNGNAIVGLERVLKGE